MAGAEQGVRSVVRAATIRDHGGSVIAAISVSGIEQRFSDQHLPELTAAVVDAGKELSPRLGYDAVGTKLTEWASRR